MIRVFSHYIPTKILLLLLVEALVLASAVYVGVFVRLYDPAAGIPDSLQPLWHRAAVFSSVMIVIMATLGLYQVEFKEGLRGMLLRLGAAFLLGLGIMSLFFYLVPSFYLGRGVLAITLIIAWCGLGLTRLLFFKGARAGIFNTRILVLGTGERAAAVEDLARHNTIGTSPDIVGYLPLRATRHAIAPSRILSAEGPLRNAVQKYNIEEIVIAVRDRRGGNLPMQDLLECKLGGIRVTDLSSFIERERGQVLLESLNTSWLVFGEGFRQNLVRETVKRAFDLAVSAVILTLSLPVMVFAAICIYLESGGPVLYRQERVGQGGKVFSIYKFRSMRTDAEKDGTPRWASANDDRTTRVGRIIRKLRIDELPQMFNVFKGEMSFVGPRPERPFFVRELTAKIPFYAARHSIKPGITGWAQVRYAYGASVDDTVEKLQYDLYYVKNHTLFLDILILIDTVEVVLWGKGAR